MSKTGTVQVRAGQRWPHQQPSICSNRTGAIFTKSLLDTHTVCLDNERSWELVLSVQWFLFIKRDELSRHLCSAPFLSSHLCWGTLLFPWAPPDWILPPPCHPIKNILESPLPQCENITQYHTVIVENCSNTQKMLRKHRICGTWRIFLKNRRQFNCSGQTRDSWTSQKKNQQQ